MAQYLVAIHHPDNYDTSREDEAMHHDIDVLNEEMIAAGVRIFVGGLRAASGAKSVRVQSGGKVLVTDGPYLRPRSTSVAFGYWNPLTWTRRWNAGERLPLPVRRRSRYVHFTERRARH